VWSVVDWFSRALSTREVGAELVDDRIDTVRRFFELLHRKDVQRWGELWHERARITVPYPPDGFPSTIEGKREILQGFRALFDNFEAFASELTGITRGRLRRGLRGVLKPRQAGERDRVHQRQHRRLRFRDGLIAEYHDYFDPRRFQAVVDALGQR
jgi:ketosteroid isomerase-like protein